MSRREPSQTVSFRASADLVRLIDRERASFELSRGTFVRGLISTQLLTVQHEERQAAIEEVHQQLESVTTAFRQSRIEQQRALFVTLTRIGGLEPAEAKEIVRQVFQREQKVQ